MNEPKQVSYGNYDKAKSQNTHMQINCVRCTPSDIVMKYDF